MGGTEARALLDGAGAEPRTRPGPAKLVSEDCFPQRFPIWTVWVKNTGAALLQLMSWIYSMEGEVDWKVWELGMVGSGDYY